MSYIDDAHRTLSDKFCPHNVSDLDFWDTLILFKQQASELDKIKKSLFYNAAPHSYWQLPALNAAEIKKYQTEIFKQKDAPISFNIQNFIHAIIGIATEAGELVDALLLCTHEDQPLNFLNIKEECGDLFWYLAILSRTIGVDFEQIQAANIAKLKARFPKKFNAEQAESRDLEAEKEALKEARKIEASEAPSAARHSFVDLSITEEKTLIDKVYNGEN